MDVGLLQFLCPFLDFLLTTESPDAGRLYYLHGTPIHLALGDIADLPFRHSEIRAR